AMAPGKLSPQQLREIMKATADDIDYLNPDVAGQIGVGRINAVAALQGVQDFLNGLENPQALNAIAAGPTQINLNWTKNEDNNDVMLVFTANDNFGTPVKGTIYSPGDAIPGGGIVLYRGSANTFSHTALEPTTVYFYRAYSYNSSNHYSSGKKANAITDKATSIQSLFHETFEADSPTRASWTQIQETGTGSWSFATGAGGGSITTAKAGTLNARFVSVSGTNSPITKLVTPVLDISGLTNPEVNFWYGQEVWDGDQNQLKVYYRISGSDPWVEIAHYTGNVNTWTNVTLALPNPSSTYQIAFEGINNWGYANVLDEVIVSDALSASATYAAGHISTDHPFDPSGVSTCPGSLTVNIPAGAVITGVDVAYNMTALSPAFKSHQQSRLVCTSSEGKYEANIYSGTGDVAGTQSYSRTGLTIANEVSGGGNIEFKLHSFRTASWAITDGCTQDLNRVDNNTWTVTVNYYLPLPAIHYTPLATTTPVTGNRNLDDVHISTSHPDGIATGGNAPRIYWRVNAGSWQSAAAASLSGNLYDFVIGTTSLSIGDMVEYFVIAQSVSGDIVANPGAGLVATDVNTITTYPVNPYTYTVVAGPLAGIYDISTPTFNQLSGRNITFEKVVNKVWKEVWVANEIEDDKQEKAKETSPGREPVLADPVVEASSRVQGNYKMMEVEEITYVPMENGEVYTGPLFVENTDKSKEIKGTYATITAAVAALNSLGVSGAVNFLLEESSYSAGETFPVVINVSSEHKPDATKPVTIKPGTGKTVSVTGSVADGNIFSIINTNFVTLDGSNAGGTDRSLTLENTSATFPEVILIGSSGTTPVVGSGVKNCIMINGAQTSSAVVVTAADGTAGYFNDITIQNNSISKAYIGVYALAAVLPGNGNGLIIADNDLNSSGTNSVRLIGIYVQGVDGATVLNNTVSNISNANNELVRGIQFATGTNGAISDNIVSNVAVTNTGTSSALSGIYIGSGSLAKSVKVTGNSISQLTNSGTLAGFAGIINFTPNVEITGNTVQTMTQNGAVALWGIVTSGASRVEISGNTVSGITTSTTGTPNGINIQGASTSVTVFNNRISNIKNTNAGGYSSVGLALSSTSTVADVLVYNNFIWDVAGYGYGSTTTDNGYGIRITSGGGYRLYHNSVNLATNQTATTGIPACLMIASGLGANSLDIRNNIFSMAATVGTNRCAVICNSANTVFSVINYNVYRSTGTNLGYIGSYRTNIAGWRTGTGQDVNSISVVPDFVSATDLHISGGFASPLASVGTYLNAVNEDIDGDPRNTPPFIGADEFGRSWTGTQNSVWNNNSNWNPNAPTLATEAVRIPAGVPNYPDITVAATCGYLTIDPGAEVKIAPGGSLTVADKLENNAGKDKLVIKSDNTGTGSLLHNTPGVEATVERYIPAAGYHLVSAPVTQASNPITGWFLWSYLYEFDADNQLWSAMGGSTGTPLNVKQGYMIYKYPGAKWNADTTYAFRGLLNSGAFYADVSYPNVSGNYNLVPNPYPSAIDWNAAAGWTRSNLAGSYWMWKHTEDNYGVWNGITGTFDVTKDIPVGQAFFVQATAADPILALNNDARLHSSQAFYKEKEELPNLIRLNASFNTYRDELVVLFDDVASMEYNNQEDATKMFGGTDAPQIYSLSLEEQKLTINMLPLSDEKMAIPVGFELSVEGEVSFTASSIDTFDPQVTVHLWDRLTGAMTDLRSSGEYTFYHHPDNPAERFDLLINSAVGVDELPTPEASAYFHDGWLYLNISEKVTGISTVNLFNVNGQLVFSSQAQPGRSTVAVPGLSTGVYMVHLFNEQFSITQKIITR
ncbi:MAG: T9SS type A sorting domain-containing protein, partial [Bacteroidales bacterium]|nr:T9SS type A sorting domain-containing protein [Bacteroidales bacterium]